MFDKEQTWWCFKSILRKAVGWRWLLSPTLQNYFWQRKASSAAPWIIHSNHRRACYFLFSHLNLSMKQQKEWKDFVASDLEIYTTHMGLRGSARLHSFSCCCSDPFLLFAQKVNTDPFKLSINSAKSPAIYWFFKKAPFWNLSGF